jgi:salicylate hydroxylase
MPGESAGNVHRGRFLGEIVKLLPPNCAVFGKTLTQIHNRDIGVTLHFRDGSTENADAVVACDGVRSTARKLLFGCETPANRAVFTDMYAYRGLVNMEDAVAAVGEELAGNSQVYMARDGHLVTYPIESGRVLNVVAFLKHPGGGWGHEKWVKDSSQEGLMKDVDGWGPWARGIVKVSCLYSTRKVMG